MKGIEVLALVFVDALDLDIEERFGVHVYTSSQFEERSEVSFVRELDCTPLPLKCFVVRQRLQSAKLIKVEQPSISNGLGDEAGQSTIADRYEATGSHAVRDVAKLPGPQLSEIVHHGLLEEFGMHAGDTVDAMAAYRREVGHAHETLTRFIDERHSSKPGAVIRERSPNFIEKASVDLVDDLEVTGKELADQVDWPFLEGLRKECVVGVSKGVAGDVPRRIPVHPVVVDEQVHQLGDCDGRVRVVELHCPFLMERLQRAIQLAMDPNHVLQRAAYEEVLLLQAQRLALGQFVVRVKHFGDVL